MKRYAVGCFLLALSIVGPPALGQGAKKDQDAIQGTWDVVELEADGEKLPKKVLRGMKVIFAGTKMTIIKEDGDKNEGTFKLDPSKKPKAIDMTGLSEGFKGQKMLGIYELDGDTLKLCMGNRPNKQRPTKLAAPKGTDLGLLTMKKAKK